MKFYTLIAFCLLIVIGCNQKNNTRDEAELTDSLLLRTSNLIMSQAHKADNIYRTMQQNVTDSSNWYRIEVFRGTAQINMGDTLIGYARYRRVQHWCQNNPGNEDIEASIYNHIGIFHSVNSNTSRSIEYYLKAFYLLNQPPKSSRLVDIAINLGDAYLRCGKIPNSAEIYQYALFLCDSLHIVDNLPSIYNGLALVYMELENFKMAHHFFDKAQPVICKQPLQEQIYYYSALGNCYYFEQQYHESIKAFNKARKLARQIKHPSFLLVSNANLCENYLMIDSLQQAREYLDLSQQILKQMRDTTSQSFYYIQSLAADLDISEGNWDKAKKMLNVDIDAKLKHSPRYLMLHYARLERCATKSKNWKSAYLFRKRSNIYADSLRSLKIQNNVIEMSQRYRRDTTLLHQKLALANYRIENARQQNIIILYAIAFIIIVIISLLAYFYTRRCNQKRLRRQMEKITELRMDIIRNRVSPHYIFNVLGTILPKLQRYPEMVGPVNMLIDVLRGNLLTSEKISVPLYNELTLVHRYIDLHHYSKGEFPLITWDIDPHLKKSYLPIPSMSLQIPIENALKHAFDPMNKESIIHISVKQINNTLVLSVTDNGCGYNPGKIKSTGRDTGTGLRLISRTLEILNQYNHHKATFVIKNIPHPHHGTKVELTLPLNYVFGLTDQKP